MGIANIALLLALAAGSLFLFIGGLETYALRSIKELWNLGHVLYFALMVLLFTRWPRFGRVPLLWRWPILIALTLAWGVGIEALQYGSARSTDIMDVSRDLCGSWLMLCFHPAFRQASRKILNRFLQISALAFLLYHLMPLTIALGDETLARIQFPLLSDFSTPFELDRWKGDADRQVVAGIGGKAGRQMQIGLHTTLYSGTGMDYLPSDWSTYQFLNLDIYNESAEGLQLTIRVHDLTHQSVNPRYLFNDRFHQSVYLTRGWNELKIPLQAIENAPRKRSMDMKQIADVSFFARSLKKPRAIYLDRIYLSKK